MKRTSLTLTLASLFVLTLIWSTPTAAQDTTSLGIQFVDCPDQLTVHPGDSAYYRIQAAPVTTTTACPIIHYYLVSGPGWIDSLTGWWSFYPWLENPALPSYEVEVAAFFEGDTALAGERCQFTVNVVGGETPGYTVRIGFAQDVLQGYTIGLDVSLETIDPDFGLGGFDLLISHDPEVLTFQEAFEWDIYSQCGWEYFTYKLNPYEDCAECPSALVRVVGVAETNNGDIHPNSDCQTTNSGYVGAVPVRLFGLKYLVTNDHDLNCEFSPVRFFWHDCANNALADKTGNYVFVSSSVYDHGAAEPIDETAGVEFPTFLGAQEECLLSAASVSANGTIRKVALYNGGIRIVCGGAVDEPGDININGIPYEIADAMMFARFFVEGPSAFGVHIDASIEATDVNLDGVPLTVEDFVYLARVVVGDAVPYSNPPDPSPNIAYFSQDPVTGAVSVQTPDSLGAVQLLFAGEIGDSCLSSQGMAMMQHFDGEKSYVFLYTLESGKFITSGEIFACGPGGQLIEARTATYAGAKVAAQIVQPGGDDEIVLRIERQEDVVRGQVATVDIILEKSPLELGGFEILLNYDPIKLVVTSVDESPFFQDCDWEYFTYRFGPYDTCGSACPAGFLRIVMLADLINGSDVHPSCYLPQSLPAALASVGFLVSNTDTNNDRFIPIRFIWWNDCMDNGFTTPTGFYTMVARDVYDFNGALMPKSDTFPAFAPQCIDPVIDFRMVNIDFYDGGVGLLPRDTLSDTLNCDPGDLNANGTPYEIADAVMYTRYFIIGWSVFEGADSTCVLAASDINQDGAPLTVEDLIQLILIIIDEAVSYETPAGPGGTVTLVQDEAAREVRATTADTLGTIWLKFEGDIAPQAGSGFTLDYHFDGAYTRMLVSAATPLALPSGGQLLSYTGQGVLVGAEAGSYAGKVVNVVYGSPTDVDPERGEGLPSEFALDNNYPNPFNPSTNIQYDVPRSAQVEIAIFNITGQRVKTLVNTSKAAGTYTVTWDGTNESGERVSSGMYFYRMTAGDYVKSKKMILVK